MRTIQKFNLSETKEDYLRAIYLFQEKNEKDCTVSELAKYLNLSKSTVTERLRDLVQEDLVTHEKYKPIFLTPKGEQYGKKLTYKHRIIEMFLSSILNISEKKVHEQANKMEHACSDEVVQQMANLLGNPTKCPHGQDIPLIKL